MKRSEVIRQLERVSAGDVYLVINAFFLGDPPPAEVLTVVQLVQEQARAFDAVLNPPAPETEPEKKEEDHA